MRLVTVSNRLPVVVEHDERGWHTRPGAGGLVTALSPVLRAHRGLWIGWAGTYAEAEPDLDSLLGDYGRQAGFTLKPVVMTADEIDGFYNGFSNQIIWPLFHDLQLLCDFDPTFWDTYRTVNRKFARVVAENISPDDYVWIHDYHLMGLGRELRALGVTARLGFFLHTPFPPPDLFCKLPWRSDVLEGLRDYDLIGLQTPRDRQNFMQCVRSLMPSARLRRKPGLMIVHHEERLSQIGTFPISIDFDEFAGAAAAEGVERRLREIRCEVPPDRKIVLGLDRLDYTKGIPHRLRAIRLALERYPDLHRAVTFIQVVVPSREDVPQYREQKAEIEQLVSEINGRFTQPGWVPIHHLFRNLTRDELLAYYRAADVGLITPLKDGMNLVAKEYCACQLDEHGVLILSEFAGAAAELHVGALLVNPYDVTEVADAVRRAVVMPARERRARMRRLRRYIRKWDIYAWVESFLHSAGADLGTGTSLREASLPPDRAHGMVVPSYPPVSGIAGVPSV